MKKFVDFWSKLNGCGCFFQNRSCAQVLLVVILFVNESCMGQRIEEEGILFNSNMGNPQKSFELYSISPDGKNLRQHTY